MSTAILQARQKKGRKPQQRSVRLREAIVHVVAEYEVMTVRQLYYQMEMRGYVGKTDADYDRVQYHCLQMRREGAIPYGKIRDLSRVRRKVTQFEGMRDLLERSLEFYRRNYWSYQRVNVEIWCEKEALLGVIAPVCDEYGVTFVAAKGFDSESLAYESALELRELGKPTHVYYFGDHDPSGWWIANNLEARIRDFGADVRVRHMAVHPWQVEDWGLPTRRAKKSDSRLRGFFELFGSDSCTELDAIPPDVLQAYVRHCIEAEIDQESWQRVKQEEALQRVTLESLAVLDLRPGVCYGMTGEEEAA
ncbi:MAG TPA: hypothetical protein VEZ12_19670 [Herpetosiphonaceae bacterium]|nr:hypothetical protein [Herpetosiphonaceae bacterium]